MEVDFEKWTGEVIQAELFTDFSALLFLQLFASVYIVFLGNHGEG